MVEQEEVVVGDNCGNGQQYDGVLDILVVYVVVFVLLLLLLLGNSLLVSIVVVMFSIMVSSRFSWYGRFSVSIVIVFDIIILVRVGRLLVMGIMMVIRVKVLVKLIFQFFGIWLLSRMLMVVLSCQVI